MGCTINIVFVNLFLTATTAKLEGTLHSAWIIRTSGTYGIFSAQLLKISIFEKSLFRKILRVLYLTDALNLHLLDTPP